MARKKVRVVDQELEQAEEAVPTSPAAAPALVSDRPMRTFLVRCVDPSLRGHSVRGVRIPQGGDAIVTVAAKYVRDVLLDRSVIAEEIDG